ncbi:MAG: hypothetical protein V4635_08540 [Bacteroidota bacterium]
MPYKKSYFVLDARCRPHKNLLQNPEAIKKEFQKSNGLQRNSVDKPGFFGKPVRGAMLASNESKPWKP